VRPGEVSRPARVQDGFVIIKCDGRLPADTTVSFETVKPGLARELLDRKVAEQIPDLFKRMKSAAREETFLKDPANPDGLPSDAQVVARIFGTIPITREELGEFLIARYGAETLELLVNKRIVDRACEARGITVTPEEVQAAFDADLEAAKMDRTVFVKDVLKPQHKTLYEWLEDGIRPRLQMNKLCRDRVQATAEDLEKAFEAYHGEKVECRVILWRKDEEKIALMEYPKLRDSEQEFANKATHQASQTLAAHGGKIDPIGHNTTGDEELERAAFALQPGDVSPLIGTPHGIALLRCDRRIPANDKVKLEEVRDQLVKDIVQRKTIQEVPVVFQKLREEARPKQLLRDLSRPEDLTAEVKSELGVKDSEERPAGFNPGKPEPTHPKGN
jgi:hypothetical protein